jgi:TM2 domain-containing membrane protein YozV
LIDFILVLCGACRDDRGLLITRWNYEPSVSNKRLAPAFLLNSLLGVFGVHRFYVGKIGTGLLQLFTFGGFGLWAIIDHFLLAWGRFTDKAGNRITQWA